MCVTTETRHLDRLGQLGEFEQDSNTAPACVQVISVAHVKQHLQCGAAQYEERGALAHIMVASSQTKPVSHSVEPPSSQQGSVAAPQSARFAASQPRPVELLYSTRPPVCCSARGRHAVDKCTASRGRMPLMKCALVLCDRILSL